METKKATTIESDASGCVAKMITSNELTTEELNSVELTRNAKGEPSWCVKVYAEDEAKAAVRAIEIDRLMTRQLKEAKNDV